MTIASGTRVGISYVPETTQGVTPGSPSMKALRVTQRNVNPTISTLGTEEVRSDRQIADLRHGFNRVEGTLGYELSLQAFDDMLEGAFANTWATGVSTGSTTLDIDGAANTVTRAAGSFITDGFIVGDIVDLTGFAEAANNAQFRITAVTATEVTLADPDDVLVTEVGGGDEEMAVTGQKLSVGTTLKTYTFERRFTDLSQYQVFRGVAIQQMALNITPESIVGGTFNLIGMSFDPASGTSLGAPSAAPSNSPFSSFDGKLYEGGSEIAVVTGIDLTLNNNRTVEAVVGSKTSPAVFEGQAIVTGTLTAFFEDVTLLNKFINETESSLWLRLNDLNGSDFMNLVIPKLKYTGAPIDPPQQGPVPISLPFQGLIDAASGQGNTTMMLQRSNV